MKPIAPSKILRKRLGIGSLNSSVRYLPNLIDHVLKILDIRGLHSQLPSLGTGMPGNLLKTTFLSSKVMLHRLWVKHSDPKRVLLIGIRTKIDPFLSFISVNQFLFDIVWLYGALQQSLLGKGSTIVKSYECAQDGILVWKKFLAT